MNSVISIIIVAVACRAAIYAVDKVVGRAKKIIDKPIKDYEKKHPEIKKQEKEELKIMPEYMGKVEAPLYVLAFYLGFPEFIVVWLTLKAAGNSGMWSPKDPDLTHLARAKYMSFLMKSGISIAICVVIALAAKGLVQQATR